MWALRPGRALGLAVDLRGGRLMRNVGIMVIGTLIMTTALARAAAPDSEYTQWLEQTYPSDGPGAAAIVVKEDKVVFRGASGLADMELGVPLSPDNVFRIGSITKQFTAAAIMLLADQGKLSVSDSINEYLPDYPTHGHTITIENLLTHTSGVFNYTSIPGYFNGAEIRKDVSTDELIQVFADLPMDFSPGEKYRYSNSGYVLLGAIIEKASGQSYSDFIQTAIFDKLGLENSYYGGPQLIPYRARGYQGTAGEYSNAGYLSMTQPHGAGALLSTVDDLAKWTAALFGGDLVSGKSLELMTTDYELNNGDSAGYGYGLGLSESFGARQIAHSGGIHGFASSGIWLPDHNVYAVVLSNNPGSGSQGFLAARMALDAAGVDYPQHEAIASEPERFSEYVGVYRINERETRTVVVDDGHLVTQRTGGGKSKIVAYAEDVFFYPGQFTHLKFDRDNSGRVVAMDMFHNGGDEAERAERESDSAVTTADVAEVSPEIYDLWAGRYEVVPGTILSVKRAGDHLTVQMTGQPEFEVLPLSMTRYFLTAVDAEVEFTAGEDGRGESLVIYQGGAETIAHRID